MKMSVFKWFRVLDFVTFMVTFVLALWQQTQLWYFAAFVSFVFCLLNTEKLMRKYFLPFVLYVSLKK